MERQPNVQSEAIVRWLTSRAIVTRDRATPLAPQTGAAMACIERLEYWAMQSAAGATHRELSACLPDPMQRPPVMLLIARMLRCTLD